MKFTYKMKLFKVHKSPALSVSTMFALTTSVHSTTSHPKGAVTLFKILLKFIFPVLVGVQMSLCTTPEGTVNIQVCAFTCVFWGKHS